VRFEPKRETRVRSSHPTAMQLHEETASYRRGTLFRRSARSVISSRNVEPKAEMLLHTRASVCTTSAQSGQRFIDPLNSERSRSAAGLRGPRRLPRVSFSRVPIVPGLSGLRELRSPIAFVTILCPPDTNGAAGQRDWWNTVCLRTDGQGADGQEDWAPGPSAERPAPTGTVLIALQGCVFYGGFVYCRNPTVFRTLVPPLLHLNVATQHGRNSRRIRN